MQMESGMEGNVHDDTVRSFPDDFHTAVVGGDLEMFHIGYRIKMGGIEWGREGMRRGRDHQDLALSLYSVDNASKILVKCLLSCVHPHSMQHELAFRMQSNLFRSRPPGERAIARIHSMGEMTIQESSTSS
jgi:hypothetical protein